MTDGRLIWRPRLSLQSNVIPVGHKLGLHDDQLVRLSDGGRGTRSRCPR